MKKNILKELLTMNKGIDLTQSYDTRPVLIEKPAKQKQ